ncbi:BZ3500_MvSof-1268-A1-R1_Chr4-2g06939 [Microbotryum saponariae]|uniref:BZ3500_MvSof-1268-A1-R1_Chr4-2g06939 protein n=1 Tax=Microbotryum saponariae TaxID=289078 RepID=A0A2X0LHQ8_9BASI|nr:BZ3500_MvSof-1268-A1-R1_Chr4-2g06939 [Microbotryum saponariae]SDA06604.1 BZ3501_MvSof-1269-A2-R1_Chr4-2g06650 [Microbotryum saponariae]
MESTLDQEFYLRYYTGHSGQHGHEFLEFEFTHDGRLRYANNSNYRRESLIRKECWCNRNSDLLIVWLSQSSMLELQRIISQSGIIKENDTAWPKKNVVGKQELELKFGRVHASFETAKIGSLVDVQQSDDPEGLRVFYYLVQDLKIFVFSLITLHYKIKPVGPPENIPTTASVHLNTHTTCRIHQTQ